MKRPALALTVVAALALQSIMQCSGLGGGDDVITDASANGHMYCYDGRAARNARLEAVPSGSLSYPSMAAARYFSVTDTNGRYEFPSLPRGDYNIFCIRDTMRAMLENVSLRGAVELPNDTLKAPGNITGIVRLAGGDDNRAVLIMAMGASESNPIITPNDTSGIFTFKNLAEGRYQIRLMPVYSTYPVLDTIFSVLSGKSTDAGTIELKKKE